MTPSYTGFAYFFVSIAAGLLNYRFFQYWQKEKSVVSKYFFFFLSFFTLFTIEKAIVGTFFANNTLILKGSVIGGAFLQGLACAFAGYIIFYVWFPKISPWVGFSAIFILGLLAGYLTAVTPFTTASAPILEPSGSINWGIQPIADTFRGLLFLTTLFPLAAIFFNQYRNSQDFFTRSRAIGFSFVLALTLSVSAFDFFLGNIFGIGIFGRDIFIGISGIILFIIIFLVQKPPQEKSSQEPISSSPKIQW